MTKLDIVISLSNKNKYSSYYSAIISRAFVRGLNKKEIVSIYGYVEKHHITPESFERHLNQDLNTEDNMVFLTAKEHFIAHLCLARMFDEKILKQKMWFAMNQMLLKNKHQSERYTSRSYTEYKTNRPKFKHLYKGREIKYVYESDTETYNSLLLAGWSVTMPEEYKKGRVGMGFGKRSEETKRRISEAHKGKDKPWLKGRVLSEENKHKLLEAAKARKGIPLSPEHLEKIRAIAANRVGKPAAHPHSEETKNKQRLARYKRLADPTDAMKSAWEARKDFRHSEENKKKIGERSREYWTRRKEKEKQKGA